MMKKQYVTPRVAEHSFEFRDGIADDLPFNPNQSGSDQLAKDRNEDHEEEVYGDPEWKNGLW